MRAVYGYTRVSSAIQASDGESLPAQSSRVHAWAAANGLEVAEVFTDAGISGKRADNRPALQQALAAVTKTKGILVVHSLSRLARSTKDCININEQLEKAGADLVSLSQKLDTSTASGKMTFRMMAILGEWETDQLSERVSGVLAHMKSQGLRVGKIPYGWDCLDGVNLSENKMEQAGIAEMMELSGKGMSLRGICKNMSAKAKGGQDWHPESVRGIIKRNSLRVAA